MLVPIFILVAGLGNTMKVLVIVSGCLWWSGILLLGLLGVILSLGFRAFEQRVLAWYYGLRRTRRGAS